MVKRYYDTEETNCGYPMNFCGSSHFTSNNPNKMKQLSDVNY